MSKADHALTTIRSRQAPRRSLLASGAALLLGGCAAAPAFASAAAMASKGLTSTETLCAGGRQIAHPDAALLSIGREAVPLIAEYQRNLVAFFALPSGHPDLEKVSALNNAPAERLEALLEAALPLRPTTLPGFAAKARLLRWQVLLQHGDPETETVERHAGMEMVLALALCDDLLAVAGGAA